jgi:micrococcal nuclease
MGLPVLVYEVPAALVRVIVDSAGCRLFAPGGPLLLPRPVVWPAWVDPSEGEKAPLLLFGRVLRVIDGDTIVVRIGEAEEIVRYIGVAAPRLMSATRASQPGAHEAAWLNEFLVREQEVRLELDAQERDSHGRLLAYVYAGDLMVNAELLHRGSVRIQPIPPNVRYRERFARLEREARRREIGLWNDGSQSSPPATPTTLAASAPARPGMAPGFDGQCPPTHPIKGDATMYSAERCIAHRPGGEFYEVTRAERCYATESEARLDGCRASRR